MSEGDLPRDLYRAQDVRQLDRYAIRRCGIAGLTLMERAGAAAFAVLREQWPAAQRILVICGRGNNGGDGYVLARLARCADLQVTVMTLGELDRLRGDAKAAADALIAEGVIPLAYDAAGLNSAEVLVDALLGTGLDRDVTGDMRSVIEGINRVSVPVLAIDIPSGLNADTGRVMGIAVKADVAVSFIGLKVGMFTGSGRDHCARIYFTDLSVPPEVYSAAQPTAIRLALSDFDGLLGPRSRCSHKGHFGHVLVVGGDHGFAGAAQMASEAAARIGAGLVSLATRKEHAKVICAARPEIMCHGIDGPDDTSGLLDKASVIAIGPGIGRSAWAADLLSAVLERGLPMVLDADALNLLAANPMHRHHWILTPHPGEAARLLRCTNADVQADRIGAAVELQRRYGGVCVLKGAGTVVVDGAGSRAICDRGNPGMASGGMGDVLTGVIAGLVAQGLSLLDAANLGVCIHACAGDGAARDGERGLVATDLMPWIRRLANPRGRYGHQEGT